ncbi:MAG: cytochrome b/b6 domain-containing protein [Chitinophagales bacterium]|nr:cytochrome b/b6 domain-containing protein [Chitinophagales bacterium]
MNTENKFTLLHRLLHWIMVVSMSVLFITGFLRMYWMGKQAVLDVLSSQNLGLTSDQAKDVYKALREPMWQWHEVFANVMILAFLARMIYMLSKGIRFPNPFKKGMPIKYYLQGFTYIYFYTFVLISAVTGICIEKGFFIQWEDTIEAVHKWGIYWFPIFVGLHIVGVVLAELSDKKGITSKMIGGD